ncbi:Protein kinase superfamily protein [Rhynchospora pubera]|uniref:Protein kinase superfamily protein n=1 Tax=Rhynchospora pubera TaxID=906938 RepID=A0AAV8FP78_9POAL|nr:Protein kinase superfamily protein [Rhynchospora pubera]
MVASQLESPEIGPVDCSSDDPSRLGGDGREEEGHVVDVSGNTWQLSNFDRGSLDRADEGLFVYKNTFHLLPSSIGTHQKLKTLKFFANEVEVLPPEAGELVELERVQIRVSSPRISEAPFRKLKFLKELELCKVPPRPSALSILSEISNLKCLTRLTVCHFSIRYFPPEIASLNLLEELDLSFNKLKSLPNSIAELRSLRILKITNNKLADVPAELSSLKYLQNLDLSSNRLTSVSALKLRSMLALQYLNLQFNRINYSCQVPPWICCDMRGNNEDIHKDEKLIPVDISAENDVSGCMKIQKTQRAKKSWKRHDGLQQRARQERLNHSRNLNLNVNLNQEPEPKSDTINDMAVNMSDEEEEVSSTQSDSKQVNLHQKENLEDECFSSKSEITTDDMNVRMDESCESEEASSRFVPCSKRYPDRDPDSNPKPSKVRRQPAGDCRDPSYKYCIDSFCGVGDRMPDGFYDAGRDQPFMPLEDYEHAISQDSREVILLDREQDEELDSIVVSAQLLLASLKRPNITEQDVEDELDNVVLRASFLALFVSDCFGGADRTGSLLRTRRAIVSLTKEQPFICTCGGGLMNGVVNGNCSELSGVGEAAGRPRVGNPFGNPSFTELCDQSIRFIKERHNSNVVPLGTLRLGVCRHRALLMKYLCDRMDPPIPCELMRGYLDFMPHAWNAVLVKRGDSWVRMVVDACYPTNIREETDPEYFCRYIPLSRLHVLMGKEASSLGCSFPTPSMCREIENTPARSVYYCKIGNIDAAVKVRHLDTRSALSEEIRKFECKFLAEVRILGALRNHRSIVDIYGHQLSCKWVPASDGSGKEYRLLQSIIAMEYVRGGSLKGYIEKLYKDGEKQISINLAYHIAREISCALVELHSKQIIHRDVKSENVLVDLESTQSDGRMPMVKLADFDQSVPLQSQSHTCCIGHFGVHPPCVCVGTPRWMAPEVLRAMHRRHQYGLEVDVWSYGCLLLELLTLQIPYYGLSEPEIYNHLQMRKGPRLTKELEEFISLDNHMTRTKLGITSDADADKLKLLIKTFYQCIKGEPSDRPTAEQIYTSLCSISCLS